LTGLDEAQTRVFAGPHWSRHESGIVAVYHEREVGEGDREVENLEAGALYVGPDGGGAVVLRAPAGGDTALLDGGSEEEPQGSLLLLSPAALSLEQREDWTAFLGFAPDGPMLVLSNAEGHVVWLDMTGLHAMGVNKESNFVAPLAGKAGCAAYYCVVEAPEVAVQLRGTVILAQGRATVVLAEHFTEVASEEQLTVQLTPRSAGSRGVAASELSTRELVIEELGGGRGSYAVDWFVQGVRKGREDFEVIRPWSGPPVPPRPRRSGDEG
jgi:hypothetical protein